MIKYTLEYTTPSGVHKSGYINIPDIDFPLHGLRKHLEKHGCTDIDIYLQSSYDKRLLDVRNCLDYVMIRAIRDCDNYGQEYDNIKRSYCKMSPNHQKLLVDKKFDGKMY